MQIRTSSRGALRTLYNVFALIIVVSMLGVAAPQAQARAQLGASINTRALALALCTDSGRGSVRIQTATENFVGTQAGRPIRVDASLKGGSASDAARGFLSQCGGVLAAQDQASDFVPTREQPSANGVRTSVKFQQTYNGVPVLAGEMFVELNSEQNVLSVGGETLSKIYLDTNPGFDAAAAQANAIAYVARDTGFDALALTATEPELWIYDASLLTPDDGPTVLVWRMDVRSADGSQPLNQLVLVDAQRGNVTFTFNQENFAYETRVYNDGSDTDQNNNVEVCRKIDTNPATPDVPDDTLVYDNLNVDWDDTLANCTGSGDSTVVQTQDNVQTSYSYFLHVLGHDGPVGDSLNGHDNVIKVHVHYGNSAYYDQFLGDMIFGDGTYNGTQLDIVGHEYAHSVIKFTANLFPFYQSGAIGESIADIFGEVVQHANGYGDAAPLLSWDWSVAGRSMSSPSVGTMTALGTFFNTASNTCLGTSTVSPPYTVTCDNGGIHTINGVNNHAAFLLSSYWTPEQITALYYEALVSGLTSGSDYPALAAALRQACTNLEDEQIGDGTNFIQPIVAADCVSLNQVLIDVEMDTQPATNGSPDAAYCPNSGDHQNLIFSDDMEKNENTGTFPANWTMTAGWAGNMVGRSSINVSSGAYALHGDDFDTSTKSLLTTSSAVVISPNAANAYLYFNHYYAFDNGSASSANYDGGVVEYSLDGGTNWITFEDAAKFPFATGAVNMVNGYNDAFAGSNTFYPSHTGFVRDSRGYVGTRFDISAFKGNNVKFRWVMATDSLGYDLGWNVDDVSVYSCSANVTTYIKKIFKSTKGQDGDILESGESTNKGGVATATGTNLRVGDNATDYQYRGLVSFSTSALPDTAVITAAVLKLKKFGVVGTNPFSTHGNLLVDMKKGYYGTSALVPGDFQAINTQAALSFFSTVPVSNWYAADVLGGSSNINLKGVTQYKLRFTKDDNNDNGADQIKFYTGESTTYAPQLIITYYVP